MFLDPVSLVEGPWMVSIAAFLSIKRKRVAVSRLAHRFNVAFNTSDAYRGNTLVINHELAEMYTSQLVSVLSCFDSLLCTGLEYTEDQTSRQNVVCDAICERISSRPLSQLTLTEEALTKHRSFIGRVLIHFSTSSHAHKLQSLCVDVTIPYSLSQDWSITSAEAVTTIKYYDLPWAAVFVSCNKLQELSLRLPVSAWKPFFDHAFSSIPRSVHTVTLKISFELISKPSTPAWFNKMRQALLTDVELWQELRSLTLFDVRLRDLVYLLGTTRPLLKAADHLQYGQLRDTLRGVNNKNLDLGQYTAISSLETLSLTLEDDTECEVHVRAILLHCTSLTNLKLDLSRIAIDDLLSALPSPNKLQRLDLQCDSVHKDSFSCLTSLTDLTLNVLKTNWAPHHWTVATFSRLLRLDLSYTFTDAKEHIISRMCEAAPQLTHILSFVTSLDVLVFFGRHGRALTTCEFEWDDAGGYEDNLMTVSHVLQTSDYCSLFPRVRLLSLPMMSWDQLSYLLPRLGTSLTTISEPLFWDDVPRLPQHIVDVFLHALTTHPQLRIVPTAWLVEEVPAELELSLLDFVEMPSAPGCDHPESHNCNKSIWADNRCDNAKILDHAGLLEALREVKQPAKHQRVE